MSSLTLKDYLQLAIKSHGSLLSHDELDLVADYVTELYCLENDIVDNNTKQLADDYISCCTFIRISQKKITPQLIFGSHIKSEYLNEISLCGATLADDGEIIPNENDIILKAFITELSLSEAVFNTERYDGEPITYTQFGSNRAPVYQPSIDMAQQFAHSSSLQKDKILAKLEALIEEATFLQNTAIKLNKKSKEKLLSVAKQLSSLLRDELSFDLEMVRENLDRQFVHINSEVISSVTGYLKNIAKDYLLEHKESSSKKSLIERHYQSNYDLNIKAINAKLLSLALADEQEQTVKDELIKFIDNLTIKHENKRLQNACINKGIINFGKPSGAPSFMFGDSRPIDNYISIDFEFGYDYTSEHGEMKFDKTSQITKINMTHTQFMELLQSGMTDHWVKCTTARFLAKKVESRNNETTEHDPYRQEKISASLLSQKANASIHDYIAQVNGTSASIKAREALLSPLMDIKSYIEQAIDDNEEIVNVQSVELLETFKEQNIIKVNNLLEMAGEKKTMPPGLLSHITLNEEKDN